MDDARTDWLCVAALIACIGVFGLALGLTYPLLSLMMAEAGMSDFMIGLNGAMTGAGLVLSTFFLPSAIRLFGALRILVFGLVVAAGSILLFPVSDPAVHWYPLRIVLGAALNAIFVISEAWLNSVTAEHIRGRVIGIYATVMAAGFALGPLLLVALGGTGLAPFLVGAAIVGGSVLAMLPLRGREAPGLRGMDLAALARFLRVGALLAGVVMIFAFYDAAAMTLLPVYMLRSGFSADIGAAALSAVLLGMVAAQYPVGWLLDRFSRPAVIVGCGLVAAASCALLPLCLHHDWLLWPVLVIQGGASFALYTGALTVLGERFRGGLLLAGSACFAFVYGIGGGAGPLAGGSALQGLGPDAMMLLFAVVFLALAIAVLRRPLTRAQYKGEAAMEAETTS